MDLLVIFNATSLVHLLFRLGLLRTNPNTGWDESGIQSRSIPVFGSAANRKFLQLSPWAPMSGASL